MGDIVNDDDEEAGKNKGNHDKATSKTEKIENEVKHQRDNAKNDERRKTKHQRINLSLRKTSIIRSIGVEDTGTPKEERSRIRFSATTTTSKTIPGNRQNDYHGVGFYRNIGRSRLSWIESKI